MDPATPFLIATKLRPGVDTRQENAVSGRLQPQVLIGRRTIALLRAHRYRERGRDEQNDKRDAEG